jgi:hypothetical protein
VTLNPKQKNKAYLFYSRKSIKTQIKEGKKEEEKEE